MYALSPLLGRTSRPALVALLLAAAGCGGGSGQASPERVRGPGFTFEAPSGRELARAPRSVTVLPAADGSPELESVSRFPLVNVFKPSLWPKAVVELDGVAAKLAKALNGTIEDTETVRRGGVRGRRYEIAYTREGDNLRERLTLLLAKRTEYQLLCRWSAAEPMPEACTLLETSFMVSPR